MNNTSDFLIENGCLKEYTGSGGEVVIPEGVTYFYGAFLGNDEITSIELPTSMTRIGVNAFTGCKNLVRVKLPDTITCISSHAFYKCEKLKEINIPESVISIASDAFEGCEGLQDSRGFVILKDTLFQYLGSEEHVAIPYGVKTIGKNAFAAKVEDVLTAILSDKHLISVTIPDSVTCIEAEAFAGCEYLRSIQMPTHEIEIKQRAFARCKNLADENGMVIVSGRLYQYLGNCNMLRIPEHVTSVDMFAFEGNTTLEEVVFPNHTVIIGKSAFHGCSTLKRIALTADSLDASEQAELMFGDNGKTIEVLLLHQGKEARRAVGAFRNARWNRQGAYKKGYLLPVTAEDLPYYDQLVATGEFEGIKMNEDGRLKAMVLRIAEKDCPVAEQYRTIFLETLASKFTKVVKLAEAEENEDLIGDLIAAGLITDANRKKISNALKKSTVKNIQQIADKINTQS